MSRTNQRTDNEQQAGSNEDGEYDDMLAYAPPEPINLVDHSHDGLDSLTNGQLWARNVVIDQYEIIRGSTKAGAYVVYLIRIETHLGETIKINRRYSEFWNLREQLCARFPQRVNEIPQLPPKSFISKFRTTFLAHRQAKLQYFLLCILLNPVFCTSHQVKQFVKSQNK